VKEAKRGSASFLKKEAKNFFDLVSGDVTGTDQMNRKFFVSFFTKKRKLLAFPEGRDFSLTLRQIRTK